ncbi:hypothetical protein [Marmoricola sp. URHA0025 HA25]
MRDLPVESLTCKACARQTVTRDLPPIGIDVAAVLQQLAGGRAIAPPPGERGGSPTCTCGEQALTWSSVVGLSVHVAGATMRGEVSSRQAVPTGTLSCGACSRSWDGTRADLPPVIREALSTFTGALARGAVALPD